MTNKEYISPEIDVIIIENETAICTMSNESLGYDNDSTIL